MLLLRGKLFKVRHRGNSDDNICRLTWRVDLPFWVWNWCNISRVRTTGTIAISMLISLKRNQVCLCLALLCSLSTGTLVARVAHGHHSFTAEFVADKTATLTGTVTQVWFKNPHVRYLFTVKGKDGEEESWDARGSPVVWLARKGWTKDTIKVGDTVEMYGYLGRDGIKMLSIMTITLADGTVLVDKVPE